MGKDGRPGASLYGWQEFFPNSYIFGADIDTDILFNTDKIKTYYCDQRSPEIILKMWIKPDLQENFDIIIEDGLHTFDGHVCFFENSIHKLKTNGYYIIEDVINPETIFVDKIKTENREQRFNFTQKGLLVLIRVYEDIITIANNFINLPRELKDFKIYLR